LQGLHKAGSDLVKVRFVSAQVPKETRVRDKQVVNQLVGIGSLGTKADVKELDLVPLECFHGNMAKELAEFLVFSELVKVGRDHERNQGVSAHAIVEGKTHAWIMCVWSAQCRAGYKRKVSTTEIH